MLTECASVGFCTIGPTVLVYPDGTWYAQVRAADVDEIIEEHLVKGRPVKRLALMRVPCEGSSSSKAKDCGEWEV